MPSLRCLLAGMRRERMQCSAQEALERMLEAVEALVNVFVGMRSSTTNPGPVRWVCLLWKDLQERVEELVMGSEQAIVRGWRIIARKR